MHRHDQDIIMALAEGTLEGDAADNARTEIEACEECHSDLAAQTAALGWLRSAEAVELTELESARLRKSLDATLGHERLAAAAAESPVRERRLANLNWGAIASVAAVLLAVVLVAPSLDLLSGGGDDDLGALESTVVEDNATATSIPDGDEQSTALRDDTPLAEAADEAEAFEAPAEAAAPTTASAMAGDSEGSAAEQGPLYEILDELQKNGGDVDLLVDALTRGFGLGYELAAPPFDCLGESKDLVDGSLQREVVGFVELQQGDAMVIAHFGEADTVLAVVGHAPVTCAFLAMATP